MMILSFAEISPFSVIIYFPALAEIDQSQEIVIPCASNISGLEFEIFVTIASGNLGVTPDYLKPSVSFSKFPEKPI